jgi:hypothetical protein
MPNDLKIALNASTNLLMSRTTFDWVIYPLDDLGYYAGFLYWWGGGSSVRLVLTNDFPLGESSSEVSFKFAFSQSVGDPQSATSRQNVGDRQSAASQQSGEYQHADASSPISTQYTGDPQLADDPLPATPPRHKVSGTLNTASDEDNGKSNPDTTEYDFPPISELELLPLIIETIYIRVPTPPPGTISVTHRTLRKAPDEDMNGVSVFYVETFTTYVSDSIADYFPYTGPLLGGDNQHIIGTHRSDKLGVDFPTKNSSFDGGAGFDTFYIRAPYTSPFDDDEPTVIDVFGGVYFDAEDATRWARDDEGNWKSSSTGDYIRIWYDSNGNGINDTSDNYSYIRNFENYVFNNDLASYWPLTYVQFTGGSDNIAGSLGHDRFHGHGGDDILNGRGGNDLLVGGSGDDVLYGGSGSNDLSGGEGDDTFILYQGPLNHEVNVDSVWDFSSGTASGDSEYNGTTTGGNDRIRVVTRQGNETTLEELKAARNIDWKTDGNNTIIYTIRDGEQIGLMILKNFTEDLTIDHFDIVKGEGLVDLDLGGPLNPIWKLTGEIGDAAVGEINITKRTVSQDGTIEISMKEELGRDAQTRSEYYKLATFSSYYALDFDGSPLHLPDKNTPKIVNMATSDSRFLVKRNLDDTFDLLYIGKPVDFEDPSQPKTINISLYLFTLHEGGVSRETYSTTINIAAVDEGDAEFRIDNSHSATRIGGILTAYKDADDPDGNGAGGFNYQWYHVGGDDISGATSELYRIAVTDIGKTLGVRVTYTDGGGTNEEVEVTWATEITARGLSGALAGRWKLSADTGPESLGEVEITSPDRDQDGTISISMKEEVGRDIGTWGEFYKIATFNGYVPDHDGSSSTTTPRLAGMSSNDNRFVVRRDYDSGAWNLFYIGDPIDFEDPNQPKTIDISLFVLSIDHKGAGLIRDTYSTTINIVAVDEGDAQFSITSTGFEDQPLVGDILTVNKVADDPDGNGTFSYQWFHVGGDDITGGTGEHYRVTVSDKGKTVGVRVTYTDGGGANEDVEVTQGSVVTASFVGASGLLAGRWQLSADTGPASLGEVEITNPDRDQDGTISISMKEEQGREVGTRDEYAKIATFNGYVPDHGGSSSTTTPRIVTATPIVSATTNYNGFLLNRNLDDTFDLFYIGDPIDFEDPNQPKTINIDVLFYTVDYDVGVSRDIYSMTINIVAVDEGDAEFAITSTGDTDTPVVGDTLTVNKTADDPDGNGTFSYQWFHVGGDDISGATGEYYIIAGTDVGKSISVRVTYTDGGGESESVELGGLATVGADNTALTVPVGTVSVATGNEEDNIVTIDDDSGDWVVHAKGGNDRVTLSNGVEEFVYVLYDDGVSITPLDGTDIVSNFTLGTDKLSFVDRDGDPSALEDLFGRMSSVEIKYDGLQYTGITFTMGDESLTINFATPLGTNDAGLNAALNGGVRPGSGEVTVALDVDYVDDLFDGTNSNNINITATLPAELI